MNAADTKKALLTASRAFDRAMRAKTCGEAANNLRIGQKWLAVGHANVRKKYESKIPYKYWAPDWQEAYRLDGMLPNAEMNAHLHRLDKCGVTQMQHEQRAAEERARSGDAPEKARERYERKRPKRRSPR
jgi:hypothetical protein